MQRLPLVTLLSLVVVATAAHVTHEITPEKRIIGGGPAEPHAHPYIASIRWIDDRKHMCGGSIISERWILTAAHCVLSLYSFKLYKPSDLYVVVGAISRHGHGFPNRYEQAIGVSQIIAHKGFRWRKGTNDIAVLKLTRPIMTNKNVQIASMAPAGSSFVNTSCVISGWGRMGTGSNAIHLQEVVITKISNDQCNTTHGDIDQGHICVFDKNPFAGSCNGDSGGPMMCGPNRDILAGVSSRGKNCSVSSVYTRVSYYLDWIKKWTGVEADKNAPCKG